MFFVYNLFLISLAVILSPLVAVAFAVQPKLRAGFFKKMGFYPENDWVKGRSIWIHAVSVGEINAVEGLVKRIKTEFSAYPIVVTTVTRTGQEVARKKLGGIADVISYFPYDFSFAAKAAIKAFNPALVIIAETEIWPRFVYEVNRKNIPLMLVNGRISPNSFKGYRKARMFFRNVLDKFSLILMQTESDAERIAKIGAPKSIVQVMGNLKFDISTKLDSVAVESLKESLKVGNNKVLIAGSTHSGEDEIVLEVFGKLKTDFPTLKLLLAPRHPERNEAVLRLIKASGFSNARKSEGGCFDSSDIILLDIMGELGKLYAISHLTFIGGGFSGTGGHNPLEPAIYGVPVVSGATVFNFKDIYKFMTASGAAKIVNNADELYAQLKEYLINDDKYKMASEACLEIFTKNCGATDYAIQRIKEYI